LLGDSPPRVLPAGHRGRDARRRWGSPCELHTKPSQCDLEVAALAPFVLAGDDDPRWTVAQTDRGFSPVGVLSAGAARPEPLDVTRCEQLLVRTRCLGRLRRA